MHRRIARRLSSMLGVALLAGGLTVAGATTASAVGCVGESCYNKGPVSMGCTKDQRSIASGNLTNSIFVYYSPACRAVWAIAFESIGPGYPCVAVELERARSDRIPQARLTQTICPGEGSDWTNMFPAGWYFRGIWNATMGYPDDYTPWAFR